MYHDTMPHKYQTGYVVLSGACFVQHFKVGGANTL